MPSNIKNQRDCSSGKGEVQRFFLECISARTSQKTQQPVSLFSFPWMNSYINLKDKINHPTMEWTVRRVMSCNTQDSLTERKASPSVVIGLFLNIILVLSFVKECKPKPC